MNILFAADVSFNYFGEYPGDATAVAAMAEVKPMFDKADFSVINLETTFGHRADFSPIVKSGPNQISLPEFIKYIEELSPSAACLANNHVGDYGKEPMTNTINMLNARGIAAFGAGDNIEAAYRPVVLERDGERVAIIGVCENEFGIATEDRAGGAGYSLERVTRAIREARRDGCSPIVFFHGGNEHNPFPSPGKRELYRHFVDLGAMAVIAAHTHCPQGYEIYEGAPIIYSMGNFFFPAPDYPTGPRLAVWAYGYMCELTIAGGVATPRLIPYRQDFGGVHPLRGDDALHFDRYIKAISRLILDTGSLIRYFEAWAIKKNALDWMKYSPEMNSDPRAIADLKNALSCEAHNEVSKVEAAVYMCGTTEHLTPYLAAIHELQQMRIPELLEG